MRCSLQEATTVVLQLREAKNDQFARGQMRTSHLTGSTICPIPALREHVRLNPHWLNDPTLPVVASRGRGGSREQGGGAPLGRPRAGPAHSSKSKNIFPSHGNMELVKRFGGWKSTRTCMLIFMGGEQHGAGTLH